MRKSLIIVTVLLLAVNCLTCNKTNAQENIFNSNIEWHYSSPREDENAIVWFEKNEICVLLLYFTSMEQHHYEYPFIKGTYIFDTETISFHFTKESYAYNPEEWYPWEFKTTMKYTYHYNDETALKLKKDFRYKSQEIEPKFIILKSQEGKEYILAGVFPEYSS